MGSVVMAVGRDNTKFVSLACINIVIASNAGGTMSPLGGISTLFVWQHNILNFGEFFALTLPCVVNFFVPALLMNFAIPKEFPLVTKQQFELKRGSKRIVLFFALTLMMTVASNILLELPPAAGMMAGLSLLEFFNYYLTKSEHEGDPEAERSFDIFKNIGNIDWDTLLFFYGAMMIIGAVGFVGYLDAIAHFLFGDMDITLANVMIGLSSAFVDNGTLMFAVLSMHPNIPNNEWLQLTLTLGVGGSLLAIGSATGVGLLGQVKAYTFEAHLRWFPVILLSYFLSVATQIFISNGHF
jgi:Na+/H+ antiporter NhaD/arsenite permease-like protein